MTVYTFYSVQSYMHNSVYIRVISEHGHGIGMVGTVDRVQHLNLDIGTRQNNTSRSVESYKQCRNVHAHVHMYVYLNMHIYMYMYLLCIPYMCIPTYMY